jgi:hypothetical protein
MDVPVEVIGDSAWRRRSAGTTWRRVPGHLNGEHPWNEPADRFAVDAKALLLTRSLTDVVTETRKGPHRSFFLAQRPGVE